MTDPSTLEAEFAQAVSSERDAYRSARRAILGRGTSAMAFLEQQQSSLQWKTSLAAAILIGWLTKAEKFDLCTKAVTGQVEGPKPITGRAPTRSRIASVTALGTDVTPRLLEMALKTKEIGADDAQASAVFGSLIALKDLRVVQPLIEIMLAPGDESLREWAASTLGPMQDPKARQPLVSVLRDRGAPEMLRASAAVSLGTLQVREAIPDLRAVVADKSANLGFRKAAIGALGDLRDADSAEGLLRALPGTHDLPFQLYLINVVGDIGGAKVLPALKQIELHHPEEPVRDYAREAREKIEERAATK